MILETFFVAEEKRAMRVQNLRCETTFQDLSARPPDMPEMPGKPTSSAALRTPAATSGKF
jgi:hypothetical protein